MRLEKLRDGHFGLRDEPEEDLVPSLIKARSPLPRGSLRGRGWEKVEEVEVMMQKPLYCIKKECF